MSGELARRYGPWALVVGGSDGIGEAFARRLAAAGLDLILVARREKPLRDLADALRARHGHEVRTLTLDAAAPHAAAEIIHHLAELDIGLLVCNASSSPISDFLGLAPEEVDRMIDLNIRMPAALAHAFGGRMARRGRGGIILLGSLAGLQGSARIAHYAATKAYLRVLAEGVGQELRPLGVDVLACCPGPVRTPTLERGAPRPNPLAPAMDADPVARAALAGIGRRAVVIPGWRNRLSAVLTTRVLPRAASVALVSAATRRMYPPATPPAGWAPDGPTGSHRSAPGDATGG